MQSGRSVLTISADDLDIGLNGRVRYTFDGGNNGGGDFMLDPVSGVLRTNRELDRERTAKYKLKAFAVDRGQPERSTEVTITVDVLDVNDNAPQVSVIKKRPALCSKFKLINFQLLTYTLLR